jgi:hypothetical protein
MFMLYNFFPIFIKVFLHMVLCCYFSFFVLGLGFHLFVSESYFDLEMMYQ